jgi:hypothetical protein
MEPIRQIREEFYLEPFYEITDMEQIRENLSMAEDLKKLAQLKQKYPDK